MKIKILSLLVLITAFSASAQIDSLTISNLESKLTKQEKRLSSYNTNWHF